MSTDTDKVKFSLDHVGIDVTDLPAQIDFYCRAFDLTVQLQGDMPEYNFRAAMLASSTGWHLELFKRDGAAPRPIPDDPDGQHDFLGLGHVCFAVDDLERPSIGLCRSVPPCAFPRSPTRGCRNGDWRTSQTRRAISSS